ncbi:MAG: 50S ribosomal protein L13 [Oscillospiraceae bacterium]|jgi:large subunit ribosomal protein L13|nr:50S ribosomal protein L13 [Oscillospiraceae bacterium]
MSTYMQKTAEIDRSWYIIDAAGKPLGRVAAAAAHLLRGKHKPTFTPHIDGGDHVIVLNCDRAVLTGRKLESKYFRWHSGWIGGLKEIKYKDLMKNRSELAMKAAVNGMLPDNTNGRTALTRLRTYKGSQHKHTAQCPVVYSGI